MALAALGIWNLAADPGVLMAVNPYYAVRFLAENGFVGFYVHPCSAACSWP